MCAVVAHGGYPALANRHVTIHDVLTLAASGAGADGALRPLMSGLANPPVLLAAAGGAAAPAPPPSAPFAPLRAPLPPALEVLTLALMPSGLNISFGGCPAMGPTPTTTGAQGRPTPTRGGGGAGAGAGAGVLLLRLRHVYAAGEGPLAVPVTVDLGGVLAPHWNVTGAVELTLSATRPMAPARAAQVQWPEVPAAAAASGRAPAAVRGAAAAAASGDAGGGDAASAGDLSVTLAPMEIRTWALQLGA
jgi:hypothetical protein